MKKFLLSLVTLCCALAVSAATEVTFDFDNNATELFGIEGRSTNDSHDGDITSPVTATVDGVSLTVSAAAEGATNANRLWATSATLRMYSGTMTFSAPGHKISSIKFVQSKWGAANSFDSGTFASNTWTASGDVSSVVLTVAANTQLKSLVVVLDGEGGDPEPEPEPEVDPETLAGTGLGTVESPFDITRAIAMCQAVGSTATTKEFYVEGIVSRLDTKYANTFWMSEDGDEADELEFYNGKGLEGSTLNTGDVKAGDKVVAFGYLVNYKDNTPELNAGCQIYSLNGKTKKDAYTPTGDGSEENPYTVADVKGMDNQTSDGNKYWVKGFILGCASSSSALAEGDKIADTNIALAESASATAFIPAAIPAGDLRAVLGVASNPTNVGREVMVYGTLEKYFSVAAIKSVSDYKWLGDEPEPEPQPGGGDLIYENKLTDDSALEEEEPWEQMVIELTEYVESTDEVGKFTANGYVFDGHIGGVTGNYYAALYTPFFDLKEYTGVYAEWEETCDSFGDDDTILACTAPTFYYYLDETYSDDQYGYLGITEGRASDDGVAKKVYFTIPDDFGGVRDYVYFSFEYACYAADEDYDEWCGIWTIRNFALYGVKGGESGVGAVERIEPAGYIVYDLNGRKQFKTNKGLNIINGKKVVVK
mgnify:FL=1